MEYRQTTESKLPIMESPSSRNDLPKLQSKTVSGDVRTKAHPSNKSQHLRAMENRDHDQTEAHPPFKMGAPRQLPQ